MTILRIKTLNIQKFRGIIDEELDLDGKNLLLKGDNGTGKSSIVSAIEFFFTGEISPLKGVQGLSIKKHAPHVKFNPEDLNIEVEFKDGTCLNRTLKDEPIPPSHIEKLFTSANEQKFILHRTEILEFIVSQPAERYRAIGNILGIESLDKIELKFKNIRDDFQFDYNTLTNSHNEIKSDLTKILDTKISNINDIIIALNDYLKNNKFPQIESLESIPDYSKEKFESVVKKGESSEKIIHMKEIINIIDNFPIDLDLVDVIDIINQIKEDLCFKNAKIKLKVRKLLKNGQAVIEEEKMDICPLCEQEINRENLLTKLKERLELIESLSSEHSELIKKSNLIIDEIEKIKENLNLIKPKIFEHEEFNKDQKIFEDRLKNLEDLIENYTNFEDFELLVDKNEYLDNINRVKTFLHKLKQKSNEILSEFSLTDKENKIYDTINLLQQIETKKNKMLEIEQELDKIKKQYEISEKLYTYFSDTKKERISSVYETLKKDIQQFYQSIHPEDPHKNVELEIVPGKRASTILKIDSFNRTREDPRALTSEGHLDTLGICIFLAFVKKFNGGCPLIILDDIVTTVDANHRENLAKLLLNEFSEFQIIITTHDGIWYQQLCSNQRTCGVEGKFKNLRIIGWDLDTGPKILPYKPRWIKIQENLENGDYDIGGMLSRRYLEWILKEICGRMKGKIEFRRDGKYMIGVLLDSAENRMTDLLNKLVNGEEFKNNILEIFKNLRSNQFMVNLLAHDNPLIEELSDSEIVSFCNIINSFYESFLCPKCRNFIIYEQTFKEIKCGNKKCKNPIFYKIRN